MYKEKLEELKAKVIKLYPEARFINVDLGQWTGYIIIRINQDKMTPIGGKSILNRFGCLDEILTLSLDGDLTDYRIELSANQYNCDVTDFIIQIRFDYDGLDLFDA